MRTINFLLLLTILSGLTLSCTPKQDAAIVQKNDIEKYLSAESFKESAGLAHVESSIMFWSKKLASDTQSLTYTSKLASSYSKRFGITKDVEDLHRADSLYKRAFNLSGGKTVGSMQTLAQLSITKHHFKDSQQYSFDALAEGYKKQGSHLLLFDAMMERGDYRLAKENLDRIKNKNSFAYLTRMFKYKDYKGELDSAIYYMERASQRIDYHPKLRAWANSNLADLYGHDNRVQDSYNSYLKVLQGENTGGSYLHSLKGVAWIAYAHDKNDELATRILQFVDSQIKSPDIKRTLAKIAAYQGDEEAKAAYLEAFVKEARKPAYYGMYDAYLINLAASTELKNTDWAMTLIDKELENRPNPQTYDLQACTYLQRGDIQKALRIVQQNVEDQTAEPLSAYHMAKVYKANGMAEKAKQHYEAALFSSFELGPAITDDINRDLKTL